MSNFKGVFTLGVRDSSSSVESPLTHHDASHLGLTPNYHEHIYYVKLNIHLNNKLSPVLTLGAT
jgi:hypothetical protein